MPRYQGDPKGLPPLAPPPGVIPRYQGDLYVGGTTPSGIAWSLRTQGFTWYLYVGTYCHEWTTQEMRERGYRWGHDDLAQYIAFNPISHLASRDITSIYRSVYQHSKVVPVVVPAGVYQHGALVSCISLRQSRIRRWVFTVLSIFRTPKMPEMKIVSESGGQTMQPDN